MREKNTTTAQLLIVEQNNLRFGIPTDCIRQIFPTPAVTQLPRQPEILRGILNHKGSIVPLFSFRRLCGHAEDVDEPVSLLLNTPNGAIGLCVPCASDVIAADGTRLPHDSMALNTGLLHVSYILDGSPAIFVLNLDWIARIQ